MPSIHSTLKIYIICQNSLLKEHLLPDLYCYIAGFPILTRAVWGRDIPLAIPLAEDSHRRFLTRKLVATVARELDCRTKQTQRRVTSAVSDVRNSGALYGYRNYKTILQA